MNGDVGRMNWIGTATVGKLGTREFEPKFVRSRLKIDESLEVGARHWPGNRREVIIEPADCEGSIKIMLGRVANSAMNQEHLLIDLASMLVSIVSRNILTN